MHTRFACIFTIPALMGVMFVMFVMGCDPKAAEPDGMETTTSGSETTDGDGDGTSEGTTGDPQPSGDPQGCVPPSGDGFTCEVDADCAISGDCCGCAAYNPNQGSPGNCGGMCDQNKCEEWGIEQAACVNGECAPQGLSCNQALVTCDLVAPECEPGFLPRVWDGCFAGDCLPIGVCDWAPGCDACAGDQTCMHETRGGCDYDRCVGPIAECQGQEPCACIGGIFCQGMCTPAADGFACM